MRKKYRHFILVFTATVALLILSSPVLALEIKYPVVLGVDINTNPTLPNYIKYFFSFTVVAAGIIGIITIVVAGVKILLQAGSPAAITEAKERMWGAILGIVLLMSSFILLRTINPKLANPETIKLDKNTRPGAYLERRLRPGIPFNPLKDKGTASLLIDEVSAQEELSFIIADPSDPNIADEKAEDYNYFFYYCPPGTNNNQTLLLWLYDEPNFIITDNAKTIRIPCGNTNPNFAIDLSSWASYFWDYENAGVYYYRKPNCEGIATYFSEGSPAQQISADIPWFNTDQIGLIDQTVYSFKILNHPDQSFNYGVILNQDIAGLGECSEPIIKTGPGEVCVNIGGANSPQTLTLDNEPFNPWYAYVVKQDKNPEFNFRNAGVTFWSPNLQYTLDQSDNPNASLNIGKIWKNDGNLDNVLRSRANQANNYFRDVPPDECLEFKPENPDVHDSTYGRPPDGKGYLSCLNKITIVGDYNVILYTHNEEIFYRSCKIFSGEGEIFYDNNIEPPYSNLPGILSQYQTIYKTFIIPVIP